MTDKARELLAAEYTDGRKAKAIRIGHKSMTDDDRRAIAAINTALRTAPDGLKFSNEVIDKMQAVMAVHGFTVPVRVISDAFRTTLLAAAQEAE